MTIATPFVVAASVADIRREPDPDSELVTQALLNTQVIPGETTGEWTYVQLSDYEGWIRTILLAEPIIRGFCKVGEYCGTELPLSAVIIATHTPLYAHAEGNEAVGTAYLSSALPIQDVTQQRRLEVALPGERLAWLDRTAFDVRSNAELYPAAPVRTVTNFARAFLGRPYLWGGTSWQGLDCSGFVQLCYRMGGSILPRDAHQQHDILSLTVPRGEMREGDLVFFGSKRITHVALALNDKEYIHSEGQIYNQVVINSFDPADPHYYPRLDEIVWAIKRVKER